jgi:chaperonin GroEL (HSP60 family)
MKNIAFDTKLDQVISDMVLNICSRLNFTVGDGTTTATIATKSTYDAYISNKNFFVNNDILPRDILSRLEYYKNIILKKIDTLSTPLRTDNCDNLYEDIKKVVNISSNGNKEITEMIASLYKELMYPAISSILSKDGTMKFYIIEGYKIDIALTDKLYINNDDQTMKLGGSDVIIFDHKVGRETYEYLLRPLSYACKDRKRHLICIAPYYDENALSGVIKNDLNMEYKQTKDINLVLTTCTKVTGDSKVRLEDLAMLLNTTVISPTIESELITKLKEESSIYKVFDIENRGIEGVNVLLKETTIGVVPTNAKIDEYKSDSELFVNYTGDEYRIGYCDELNLGLKESIFTGFYYDKDIYNTFYNVAKTELEEVRKKCENIGTFSLELNKKQQRVHALSLKTGVIEVGSTSELSQGYLKDMVDDAIKAAASAYNNGIVLGCNVTLLKAIEDVMVDVNDKIDIMLLSMLKEGYSNVYKTVLSNVISDDIVLGVSDRFDISDDSDKINNVISENVKKILNKNRNYKDYDCNLCISCNDVKVSTPYYLYDAIVDYSINSHTVFNLSTGKFDNDVINSSETDKEILKATIDLLSLLITGNQLVLR